MEYTLRIYKNEFQASHIQFIEKNFTVVSDSANIMTVSGEEESLNKIMSAMFATDEQFKAIFPEYTTRKEREEITRKELEALKDTIATTLCRCIRDGVADGVLFDTYRNFYLDKLAK